jgi:hypothetical protein
MSRASTLAKAIGADGTLNVSDVAGLAAVASSGSASDLSTGTLPIARIADGAVTYAKLSSDVQGDMNQFKNRIINGAMTFNQRGAASSNSVVNGTFYVDRFLSYSSTAYDYLIGQNLNSITPPAGFVNYLGVQSAISTSPGSGDYHFTAQLIEGNNVADLSWGSANAKAITVSFWVRSSLTGTFGGAINNSASNRSYPFSYTISSANTWEQKSVTIPGDTTGTWLTTNGIGMYVRFTYGSGSTRSGTVNTWAAANYDGPTGATAVTATNGATWYITGLQVEVGSTATSFDYRPYGTELALCQRYFQSFKRAGEDNNQGWLATSYNANNIYMPIQFFTIMRRVPDVLSGGTWRTRQSNLNTFTASFGYQQSGTGGCILAQTASTNAANSVFWVEPDGSYSTAYLAFNGEL